ncbi:LysM peptidoglycan-binding domain-containing protein [Aquimarina sp. 2-A2]|uniref:LysM peptidoglycan-binding domain-containing protein n=1 Tax=Aquimarina sp. 2-A2 TaxID=3382644 RepID=UPI00387EEEAD
MPLIYQSNNSSNSLQASVIKVQRKIIKDAYFAIRENEPVSEGTPSIHTVVSGDTLGKIAATNRTTVAKIKSDNGLTSDLITVGQQLTLSKAVKKGDKVSFTKIKEAKVGEEVYILVKTENAQDLELKINIKQGVEDGIAEVDQATTVQQDDSEIDCIKVTVGAYCKEEGITNKDDFADWAIAKVTLQPKNTEKQKEWSDALECLQDKKSKLYLLIDAHSDNEYHVTYHGRNPDDEGKPDYKTCPNRWLDMDGKWFELGKGCRFPITPEQLLQIFPESTKTRREEVAKAVNKHSDEFEIHNLDRMSHFLGQIGTETGQLKALQESYNYSAKNIYNTFLRKVLYPHPSVSGKHTFKYHDLIEGYNSSLECEYDNPTNSDQKKYGHKRDVDNPIEVNKVNGLASWTYNEFKELYTIKPSYIQSKTLFDYVYGCRMENGNKSTADGSDYYGVGFIHLTGKEKYVALDNKWKELYPDDPKDFMGNDISLLKTNVDVAIKASMIIWNHVQNGTNTKADQGSNDSAIKKVTIDVNGGTNGLAMRKQFTKKAYEVLNK